MVNPHFPETQSFVGSDLADLVLSDPDKSG